MAGTSSSACGLGGETCQSCGPVLACFSDGACGLDELRVWRVQPVSATIAGDNSGRYWDPDASPPDVFATLGCPGEDDDTGGQTEVVESYTPSWSTGGCFATAQDLLDRGFGVQLWDQDAFGDESITGEISVQGLVEGHFTAGYMDVQASGGMLTLRIALQPQ